MVEEGEKRAARDEKWNLPSSLSTANLSPDARIRYVSSAIEDILGYLPPEVLNRPIWEFFHPDELSQARTIYSRSVRHDKAAGLNYFRVRHKHGHWVACECVFTIVCDVLIASTSVYHRGKRSQMRAADAPIVRRLFASSSRDPRYHMLSCMSTKFKPSPPPSSSSPFAAHEPRAALFLNRFTRSAAVIYATPSIVNVLGIPPSSLISTSFYYCIEECCLPKAVQCLESAKANDSIAYLRFWFRDPTDHYNNTYSHPPPERRRRYTNAETNTNDYNTYPSQSGCGQGPGSEMQSLSTPYGSSTPTSSQHSNQRPSTSCSTLFLTHPAPIELEAIVSCSSDGLLSRPSSIYPGYASFAPERHSSSFHLISPVSTSDITSTASILTYSIQLPLAYFSARLVRFSRLSHPSLPFIDSCSIFAPRSLLAVTVTVLFRHLSSIS
ncbi:hypothetical protein TEQG_00123 [Trichophyton equinum CBS 127.97]|uniref:PAS domain-containing protein n=1 Tax=Trichophyton equinum (strain ATCC MYA-4606 / CBS 127.97) TaxID=559882 RepID=F2PGQ1_TRIEC|nr:hypothetical protein TEQG_00123 [Trichophyton equinum CBS 127.97]